ncbi:MAG: hypothetical protein COW01_06455 [Bdellovibrionales bacterium CG12_big_fil_rev_8_21_14_0_65_38_15]|nr:MAG: hypothetical protein COW79_10535 [Bdellovibrionales bacterium CG22_combo_CG10-13_8_21_14_all_38_13]PIQ55830.1 MAG: hypothetical protein COW01_06455 [Bdellovibrionales bacterium CG12_big_fil_rev_8_21_14_0_65_38_15]PIR28733.1 MAG: hypothetical protein COV38_14435 [Bdellovibrionales bacterium CG11_big_fil_rev_8_21_14_0_20_38_13]
MPTVSVCEMNDNNTLDQESSKNCTVNEGEILFDELEKQEIKLPHGCLAGSCGSCRVWVVEGADQLKEPSAIEQNTLDAITQTYNETVGSEFLEGKVLRLSCRARVQGSGKIVIAPLKK